MPGVPRTPTTPNCARILFNVHFHKIKCTLSFFLPDVAEKGKRERENVCMWACHYKYSKDGGQENQENEQRTFTDKETQRPLKVL